MSFKKAQRKQAKLRLARVALPAVAKPTVPCSSLKDWRRLAKSP